jgi:cytochrome c-550 PedF
MLLRRRAAAVVGLIAGLGSATLAWAHGDVVPQAVDTTGLTPLGQDLQAEDPYRGQPDYVLAQKIGAKGFNQNCARCHGLGAVSGGIAPDLRLLVPVDDDGYFIGRVMSGSIRDGVTYMPPFEGVLSQEAIWAIRSWLDTVAQEP